MTRTYKITVESIGYLTHVKTVEAQSLKEAKSKERIAVAEWQELNEIEDCEGLALLHTAKAPTKHKTDAAYVRAVLAGRVASCVADGDLEPPAGAKCRTRAGFRAWLRRACKPS